VLPAVVTRAVVSDEFPAVLAWVEHHPGWAVEFDEETLHLVLRVSHPATGTQFVIDADLEGYRAVPPAWRFLPAGGGEAAGAPFPQAGTHPLIPGSIFHSNRVICAPWNRLAYKENNGPHEDWGALTGWMDVAVGYTKADALADMLSQIDVHLAVSPGVQP